MQTIVIVWLVLSFLASVLVVAALMLSSRLSQKEDIEEPPLPERPDVAAIEQLMRFPHGR